MKYYLKDIIPRLKKQSATLDQSSFLVDKPWVVNNSDGKFEKLIFKRDGTLYLSSDGDVRDGKWEYLPEAQSLLIDYGNRKKLYRHQYLDEAVLALKIDGPNNSEDDYYLLANENEINDYDAKKYLVEKYDDNRKLFNEAPIKLPIIDNNENFHIVDVTSSVSKLFINNKKVESGRYKINDGEEIVIVKRGVIQQRLKKVNYRGSEITFWQQNDIPSKGDFVEGFINQRFFVTASNDIEYRVEVTDEGQIQEISENSVSTFIILLLLFFAFIILLAIGYANV